MTVEFLEKNDIADIIADLSESTYYEKQSDFKSSKKWEKYMNLSFILNDDSVFNFESYEYGIHDTLISFVDDEWHFTKANMFYGLEQILSERIYK